MISGNFSFQEATDLALLLRSGALPTPLIVVEERTVGPDLGEDSIKSGTISLIVGFILVILFMFYKYKIFGLIANTALIANLLMLIGILTILEATLTLPGIAGIILTVGMAVDANVLIFERIKEELKTEKSIIHAFDTGYTKAKITVLRCKYNYINCCYYIICIWIRTSKRFCYYFRYRNYNNIIYCLFFSTSS